MEPQSKTNKQTKAHGSMRLEFAASSSKKEQVQSWLGSTGIFSKEIPGCLHRGLLLRYKILLSCRTRGTQLGAESPLRPDMPGEWSHRMDSILK